MKPLTIVEYEAPTDDRGDAIVLAYLSGGYTPKELG
jgi:hypothetical protein